MTKPAPMPPRKSFRVTLTDAHRHPESVHARLKRLLKTALRAYGFRAGGVEVSPEPKKEKSS